MRNWVRGGAILVVLAAGLIGPSAMAADLLVFAAASLQNALDGAIADYGKRTGVTVAVSYAASGPLARQIDRGAPADLFISADEQWMDDVQDHHMIDRMSRVDLLGNRLVLISGVGNPVTVKIGPGSDLVTPLDGGRLAIGDPLSVPAGKYAKTALENLGLWDKLAPRLAEAESVRAALALVSRGEVTLGIVYATDAAADPAVRIAGEFPASASPRVIYPAALIASGRQAPAAAFLTYLESPAAAGFFTSQGFTHLRGPGGS